MIASRVVEVHPLQRQARVVGRIRVLRLLDVRLQALVGGCLEHGRRRGIATSRTTTAIRPSALISFRRAAAGRVQDDRGPGGDQEPSGVGTGGDRHQGAGGNDRTEARLAVLPQGAPPKATRPSARNMLDSLCRRPEKKTPLGSMARSHAAHTAARRPARSYTAVTSRTSPATARPTSAMRRANSGESSAQTWTASTNWWKSPTRVEVQSPEPRGKASRPARPRRRRRARRRP